jgi:hypothetical protein
MNKLLHYKPILNLLLLSISFFIIHKIALHFIDINKLENTFVYSLIKVYSFFLFCSLIIVFILIQVNKKSPTNVGFTFMLLTTAKMGFAYVFLKPILHSTLVSAHLEKYNFFIVFLVFLTIETLISIKMLNNKQ